MAEVSVQESMENPSKKAYGQAVGTPRGALTKKE